MRAKKVQKHKDECKFHWMMGGVWELHYHAAARHSRAHMAQILALV
jgi:hypothetical protein